MLGSLFLLDAERVDNAGDSLGVIFNELFVIVAAEKDRGPTELLERRFPCRGIGRRFYQLEERIPLRRRNTRGAEHAAPIGELYIKPLLFECPDAIHPRRCRYGQGTHTSPLDLFGEFADTRDAGGDMAADDGRHRLATPFEGHVIDLGRIDT